MSTKTILIFDDNKAILDTFSIVLQSFGYEVATSSTSHDIIEKVENFKPDLIIMDNWIPEIGGVKATQLLKNHTEYKNIPVIICSATNDIESLAGLAGAEGFLSKPFDIDDLEKNVADLINN